MQVHQDNIKCPECGEEAILTDTHWVCPNDGLVIQSRFDQGSVLLEETSRSYGKRYAAISNDPQQTIRLGTTIGWLNGETRRDAHHVLLDFPVREYYKSLNWRNNRIARHYSDERLLRWMEFYNRVCNVLNLPQNLQKDGATLLRKVYEKSDRYLRMKGYVAAIIYLICRYRQYILPLSKIEETFRQLGYPTSGKEIVKCAMAIRKLTRIKVRPFAPRHYVVGLIENLKQSGCFDDAIQRLVRPVMWDNFWIQLAKITYLILENISERELTNRNPRVLAAATIVGSDISLARDVGNLAQKIYVTKRKRGVLTQTLVASILEIKEYTLREHYLVAVKPALAKLGPM